MLKKQFIRNKKKNYKIIYSPENVTLYEIWYNNSLPFECIKYTYKRQYISIYVLDSTIIFVRITRLFREKK